MNPYFNENTVLEYVKRTLGVPFNIIEFDDDFLINNIILEHNYLKEFSQYFPKEERIYLTAENNEANRQAVIASMYPDKYKNQTAGLPENNRWYLECENEILGVKDVISTSINTLNVVYNDSYIFANPIESATNNLMRSMTGLKISYKFFYPNVVEVYGYPRDRNMLAILDVVHDKDLSSIPSTLHMSYNRFCLYNTANYILHIRNKYSEIETPFGSINLNIEFLQSLADKKEELIQEFKGVGNYAARGLALFVI